MRFIQIRPESRDCTTLYKVELSKPYTVKELVDEVLSTRAYEWGCFRIMRQGETIFDCAIYGYKYGQLLEQIPDAFLTCQIAGLEADGGYSAMDYFIKIK